MSSEMVAAIAALWAAVATTWAAIATSRAVAATRKAPIDAARVAASLQEANERRRLKLWVFATIMQNRHFIGETDGVRTLNLIDTVFHDAPAVRGMHAVKHAAERIKYHPSSGSAHSWKRDLGSRLNQSADAKNDFPAYVPPRTCLVGAARSR